MYRKHKVTAIELLNLNVINVTLVVLTQITNAAVCTIGTGSINVRPHKTPLPAHSDLLLIPATYEMFASLGGLVRLRRR